MFKEILENESIVVAKADSKLRYVWIFNPHSNFSVNDVIGKTDYQIDPNPGAFKLMELKKRVIETGTKEEAVIKFPCNSGDIKYKVIAEPVINNEGKTVGVITVSMDITNIIDNYNNVNINIKENKKEKSLRYSTIGSKIKLLREVKDLTQNELAIKADLSQSYISALESDEKNPTIQSLGLISKALNFTLKELLDFIL